jgi:hypothetical protein
MMKQTLKFLLLISIAAVMAGCKLAVIVVEGGEVQSIGSGTCLEGTICVHQVSDTNYTETFTAVPNSGWAFVKWNSGGGFFCQGSTDPICVISGEGAEENQAIEAIVESDETFYIMPMFVLSQPIMVTVSVDGKEWTQTPFPASWDQINAVCPPPAGVCGSGARLNGYDMSGWTWASIEDVDALFNAYGNVASAIQEDFGYGKDKSDRILYGGPLRDTPPEGIMYITLVISDENDPSTAPGLVDSAYELGGESSDLVPGGVWLWR